MNTQPYKEKARERFKDALKDYVVEPPIETILDSLIDDLSTEIRREMLEEAYNIVIRKRTTDECQRYFLDAVHASRNKSNT